MGRMTRRIQGFKIAAGELAKNGLISEFMEFVNRYSESMNMYKTVLHCLHPNVTNANVFSIVEYFTRHGYDIHEHGEKFLLGCLTYRRFHIAKHFIQQGLIATPKLLEQLIRDEDDEHSIVIISLIETMIDSIIENQGQEQFQSMNVNMIFRYKRSQKSLILTFHNKGYDFGNFVLPIDSRHIPSKETMITLNDVGTDFSSINWTLYLIDIFMMRTITTTLKTRVELAKTLISLGVGIDPNSDDVRRAFCNCRHICEQSIQDKHFILDDSKLTFEGQIVTLLVPKREYICGQTGQKKYSRSNGDKNETLWVNISIYPKELLDILIDIGLHISEYTVFHLACDEIDDKQSDFNLRGDNISSSSSLGRKEKFRRMFIETQPNAKFIVTQSYIKN